VVVAVAIVAGCFDFDATTAGGPLEDAGGQTRKPDGASGGGDDGAAALDGNASGGDASGGYDGSLPEGGSFCAANLPAPGSPGLFFCSDFDEVHSFLGPWQTIGETSGTLVVTDASAASPPNSIEETTDPLDDGGVINVAIRSKLTPLAPLSTLRFAFAMQLRQIDTTTAPAAAAIVLGAIDFLDNSNDRYSVGLAINVQNFQGAPVSTVVLDQQTGYGDGGVTPTAQYDSLPSEGLALNEWHNIVLEVDLTSASGANGIVTVDGQVDIDQPLAPTVTPTTLQVGVGTSYVSQPSPGWQLFYDNVIFNGQ
jgi:hypothetical protein